GADLADEAELQPFVCFELSERASRRRNRAAAAWGDPGFGDDAVELELDFHTVERARSIISDQNARRKALPGNDRVRPRFGQDEIGGFGAQRGRKIDELEPRIGDVRVM